MSLYVYGGVSVECVHISLQASGMFNAASVKEKEKFVRTMASNALMYKIQFALQLYPAEYSMVSFSEWVSHTL